MAEFPAVSSASGALELAPFPGPPRTRSEPGSLRHAAGEFEAILLNQWLEGAESTFGSVPGADSDQDAGDAQMKSFAMQALARGITAAGGIGLSAVVSKALETHPATDSLDMGKISKR